MYHSNKQSRHRPSQKKSPEQLKIATLLQTQRFMDVVNDLGARSELSREQRYAYGYAQLRQGFHQEALCTWLPLLGKWGADFDADCLTLACSIFADPQWQEQLDRGLALPKLKSLYLIARALLAPYRITGQLRRHLLQALWENADFDSLEQLLSSSKEPFSAVPLMNLAKVRLRRHAAKDPVQFIGLFLAAAATFVAQRRDLCPFPEGMRGLTNELKLWLEQNTQANRRSRVEHQNLMLLIEREVNIITRLVEESGLVDLPLGVMAGPTYLRYLGPTSAFRRGFYDWLQTREVSADIRYPYDDHDLLLVACGLAEWGKRAKQRGAIDFLALPSLWRVYLAVQALRAKNGKALALFDSLVEESYDEALREALNLELSRLYAELQGQAEHLVIWFWAVIHLPSTLWQTKMRSLICRAALEKARGSLASGMMMTLTKELGIAHSFADSVALQEQIGKVLSQRQEISDFLTLVAKPADRARLLRQWCMPQKKAELEKKLAFLAQAVSLLDICRDDAEASEENHSSFAALGSFTRQLFKSRACKKSLSFVADFFADALQCDCEDCTFYLLAVKLPEAVEKFQLPLIEIPSSQELTCLNESTSSGPSSVIAAGNPFAVLQLGSKVSKAIIMQRVMECIRENPKRMVEWRQAQGELFIPERRIAYEFLNYLEHEPEGCGLPLPDLPINSLAQITLRGKWNGSSKH